MPQSAQDAIILLLRAWAVFELALTDWLIAIVGMKDDLGILLIGRMDTRNKIVKLKEIYEQLRDAKQVLALKGLGKANERYSQIRNTVVHNVYLGHRPDASKPGEYELIYSTHRPVKGRRDAMDAVIVRLADLKSAATFAGRQTKRITDALRHVRRE
jgi:hypothetical protein